MNDMFDLWGLLGCAVDGQTFDGHSLSDFTEQIREIRTHTYMYPLIPSSSQPHSVEALGLFDE